jgi:hypothetical protein
LILYPFYTNEFSIKFKATIVLLISSKSNPKDLKDIKEKFEWIMKADMRRE